MKTRKSKLNLLTAPRARRKSAFLFALLPILAALFGRASLYAQLSGPPIDTALQFHRLTMDQGLPGPDIYFLTQDREGYIWLGTDKGASRFDGLELRTIPLGTCNFFFSDSRDRLWIGANELSCMDPRNDSVRTYHVDPADTNSLGGTRVGGIAEDSQGYIWVGHDGGIDRLDNEAGHFTHYRHPQLLLTTSMVFDRQGHLWAGTRNDVVRFDPRTNEIVQVPLEPRGTWVSVSMGPDGTIWASGNRFFGLWEINPQTLQLEEIRENGRPVDAVRVIFDSLGTLYVGTMTNGLKMRSAQTGEWTTLHHRPQNPQSINDDHIHALAIDRGGNLWLGTASGLCWAAKQQYQFNYMPYDANNPAGPPRGYIRCIAAGINHGIWVGSWGDGLVRFDLLHKSFSRIKGVGKRVHATCADDRFLWVSAAEPDGFFRLDQVSGKSVPVVDLFPSCTRLPPIPITALTLDREKNLWIGLEGISVACLNLADGSLRMFDLDTWTAPEVITVRQLIRDSQGIVWIAGGGNGIVRLEVSTGKWLRMALGRKVNAVAEDHAGRIWIGSDNGLDLLDRSTGGVAPIARSASLGGGEGLADVIEDSQGIIWLVGEYHLFRYDPDRGRIQEFGPSRGYPVTSHGLHIVRGTRSTFAPADGVVVLGTGNGIVTFRPGWIKENRASPRAMITDILVPERGGNGAGMESLVHFRRPERIDLSYDRSAIQIRFAVLDYTSPASNRLEVKLEGIDKEWAQPQASHSVYYGGLQPGDYMFRVRGASSDGVWDSTGASLRIVIRPPFWKSWWFNVLAAVIAISLAALLTRLRYARQLQLERMRLRIANDLHDEVGSSLSSIALLTDLVHDGIGESDPESKDLREISAKARGTAETLRDIVWIINPDHDRTERLVDRMKDTARSILGSIPCNFETNLTSVNEAFDIEVRRHVLLAYKEILNNIAKHARARHVKIEFQRDADLLTLRIADDGVGFRPGNAVEGNGLQSLRVRARELNGRLNISETPGGGATVELTAKIP